ncbi:UTRA domain-containing protein [Nonomuraea ferruginea]
MEFAPHSEEERRSLVARMYAHGVKITEVVESIHTRAPRPSESEALDLPVGVHVLHVERTHWARRPSGGDQRHHPAGRPVPHGLQHARLTPDPESPQAPGGLLSHRPFAPGTW